MRAVDRFFEGVPGTLRIRLEDEMVRVVNELANMVQHGEPKLEKLLACAANLNGIRICVSAFCHGATQEKQPSDGQG